MNTLKANLLIVELIAVCAASGQTTGSIAGTVLENGSSPLAGSTVTYTPVGHFEKDTRGRVQYVRPATGGSVLSRADGTFTITGLTAGQYVICARGTLPIHISSCAWNTADHRVSVASGQNQTGLRLSVNRGSLLGIAIADPAGCVAENSKAAVYVFVGSQCQQTFKVSSAAGAYQYQALVPQQVQIKVSPNHPCSFTDSSGNALPASSVSVPPIQGESASVTMTAK